jgi:hypothetical protein
MALVGGMCSRYPTSYAELAFLGCLCLEVINGFLLKCVLENCLYVANDNLRYSWDIQIMQYVVSGVGCRPVKWKCWVIVLSRSVSHQVTVMYSYIQIHQDKIILGFLVHLW